jgi:hypothetical protein
MRSVGIPNLVTSISAPSLWLFVDRRRIYADIESVSGFEAIAEAHACAVESHTSRFGFIAARLLGQHQRGSICSRGARSLH